MNRFCKQPHRDPPKDLTVIVTDSGLGGISVAAELYAQLKRYSRNVNVQAKIIFFNALFHETGGYTYLAPSAQTSMFEAALQGMMTYAPDLILIACNTLSVVYPKTPFARNAPIPVLGIVEVGVQQILDNMQNDENPAIILFGMPTTITAETHKMMLLQQYPKLPVIGQACPELAFAIGDGETEQIEQLIDTGVREAIRQLTHLPTSPSLLPLSPPQGGNEVSVGTKHIPLLGGAGGGYSPLEGGQRGVKKVYASLICTHFGYYQDEFTKAFRRHGIEQVEVFNPNSEMVNRLFAYNLISGQDARAPYGQDACASRRIEFLSKTKINEKGLKSLCPLLEKYSKEVVRAFQHYQHKPDLF